MDHSNSSYFVVVVMDFVLNGRENRNLETENIPENRDNQFSHNYSGMVFIKKLGFYKTNVFFQHNTGNNTNWYCIILNNTHKTLNNALKTVF